MPPRTATKSAGLTRHNGASIRYLRIKTGLKVKELADRARCQYSHIDNLENERKEASVELLHRIAGALDVPVVAIVRDPAYALRAGDSRPSDAA